MALEYAHGSVEWLTTDAVATTYAVSGLSFQPKAIHCWTTGIQSAIDATSDALHWMISVGFATGTADRRSVASYSQDTAGTSACGVAYRTSCVICLTDSAAADGGQLDISAVASDGFTFRVDVQNAVQHVTVFWEAWGGDTLTNAVTGEISEPAATGAVDYTVPGTTFQPDVLLFASTKQLTADGASAIDSGIGVGCATSGGQWTFSANSDDGSAAMDTDRYGRSDECISVIVEAGGNPDARASFTQFNADGFKLTWAARATTNRKTIYLAMKGGVWRCGTYTINATVLNTTAVVPMPFQPIGCLQATHGFSEQAAGTSTTFACLSIGCFSSTSSRRTMGVIDENATASSACEIDQLVGYAAVIAFPNTTGAPPGVLKAIDVSAIGLDGFTMIVDTAGSASTDLIGYLAFTTSVLVDPIGGVVPVPR